MFYFITVFLFYITDVSLNEEWKHCMQYISVHVIIFDNVLTCQYITIFGCVLFQSYIV